MENHQQVVLQIAALVTHGCLRVFTFSIRSFFTRKVLRFYSLWKNLALDVNHRSKYRIQADLFNLRNKLLRLFRIASFKLRIIKNQTFCILQENLQIHLNQQIFNSLQQKLLKTCEEEIQELNKSLQKHQNKNVLLEKQLKNFAQREKVFKERIQETSENLNKRKKDDIEKAEEIDEMILNLKDENSGLREKIEMIENNINNFLGEIGGLLEVSDQCERKNVRRSTLRKNK